ncbi:hypothetical protein [Sulfuricurvum sp.]|uniref:hypothetical protein n=1 Tax=Sulfuricurvum sp. TaxID=2025608 RepID=UPI002D6FFAAE|nr:hypothetical protein [Sulfuricurvum sp.]HZF71457.1 hypothetical protein [Sulfuricurvum sp.]
MQRFTYLLIFAIVFLLFKAFFLDSYLEERARENNVSKSELNDSVQTVQEEQNISVKSHTKSFEEQMNDTPLDRLGDSIADKLEKKL